jgi:hypothetical protein
MAPTGASHHVQLGDGLRELRISAARVQTIRARIEVRVEVDTAFDLQQTFTLE